MPSTRVKTKVISLVLMATPLKYIYFLLFFIDYKESSFRGNVETRKVQPG